MHVSFSEQTTSSLHDIMYVALVKVESFLFFNRNSTGLAFLA